MATMSSSNGTPRSAGRRPTSDALAFNDDEAQEAEEDGATTRRRRRPRNQQNGDVPLVRDAVGESVSESFETFLKTWVTSVYIYSVL
jgi:DNA replication licensing factor MCM6